MSKYKDLTKEKLLKIVEQQDKELQDPKKYGLFWDKEKVVEKVVADCENNLPVLKRVKSREIKTNDSEDNILIEGDNYHALNVLNYTHRNKIDVIYIDPPYNTGKEREWIYNDKYIDESDGWSHSKWLNFMEKRLRLAKKLLTKEGVIFVSIGNDEIAQLKMLMDKIFGEKKDNNIIHWKKNQKPQNASKTISESAEFLLVYFPNESIKLVRPMTGTKVDERGSYKPSPLFTFDNRPRRIQVIPKDTIVEVKEWKKGKIFGIRNKIAYIEILDEPIIENGILKNDVKVNGQWRKTETNGEYQKVVKDKRLFINSNGFPNEKAYRDENSKNVQTNLWLEAGYNELGKSTLDEVLGVDNLFPYPKPKEYIKEILKSINNENALVLDFFAGSGTTAHAVLELNKEDEGNRKFILCTNNELNGTGSELAEKNKKGNKEQFGVCQRVTYPRISNVIKGYDFKGKNKINIFEFKITLTQLNRMGEILEEMNKIIEKNKDRYSEIKKEFKENIIKVIGIKNIKGHKDGLGGNLKYFKTDFIKNTNNRDQLKINLTKKCTEILCVKENIFNLKKDKGNYKIFISNDKSGYLCIYYNFIDKDFDDFVKDISKLDGKKAVYIFALNNKIDKKKFSGIKDISFEAIPYKILEVYEQLVKISKK